MSEARSDESRYADELALRGLWLMNEIITERGQLDSSLKSGFIEMAQARYVMGNNAVSALKLPATMSASFVVESESTLISENLKSKGISESDDSERSFPQRKLCQPEETPEPTDTILADSKSDTSNLRRRNVGGGDADTGDAADPQEDKEKEKVDKPSAPKFDSKKDPLKWFGILIPGSLRKSQGDFKASIESCVRLVNYQEELMAVVDEYRKCRKLIAERAKGEKETPAEE